jgi:hypothetical protein
MAKQTSSAAWIFRASIILASVLPTSFSVMMPFSFEFSRRGAEAQRLISVRPGNDCRRLQWGGNVQVARNLLCLLLFALNPSVLFLSASAALRENK